MDLYIKTPEEGIILGRVIGPKGPSIWVSNIPRAVSPDEVEKLLHDIAWSPRGLRIPQGDSIHPVWIRWDQILDQAERADIAPPASAAEESA